MEHIFTSKGLMPLDKLTFSTGGIDNDVERTTWEEWRDDTGEVVKRNVHVTLKTGVDLSVELGVLG